jgi:hypothetical protein
VRRPGGDRRGRARADDRRQRRDDRRDGHPRAAGEALGAGCGATGDDGAGRRPLPAV